MVDPRTRRSRWQLIGMFAIAGATLLAAYLLFYFARSSGVWGTTNHGEFVDPPLAMAALELRDSVGRPVTEGGTWWLWVVARESCGTDCEQALHQLRQLHVLLNKDASRVQRGLVVERGAPWPAVAAEYPRLVLLDGRLAPLESGIYVVDPIGNLVFWYPFADAGKPVLEDLKRLLKLSQIG